MYSLRRGEGAAGAGDALEVVRAEVHERARHVTRDLLAHHQRTTELAGEALEARREVHRRADAGEVEAARAADVAVGDVADVQRDAEAERRLAVRRARPR